MTIINKLYAESGNKLHKVFRALGLKIASTHGVHTNKQVPLKHITNEIGELVALGYVKVHTPRNSRWNQGTITLNYAGLTNEGWIVWLKDNGKYGYYECPIELKSNVPTECKLTPNHSIADAFVALFESNEADGFTSTQHPVDTDSINGYVSDTDAYEYEDEDAYLDRMEEQARREVMIDNLSNDVVYM